MGHPGIYNPHTTKVLDAIIWALVTLLLLAIVMAFINTSQGSANIMSWRN